MESGPEWEGLPHAAAQAKEEEIAKLTASHLLQSIRARNAHILVVCLGRLHSLSGTASCICRRSTPASGTLLCPTRQTALLQRNVKVCLESQVSEGLPDIERAKALLVNNHPVQQRAVIDRSGRYIL